MFKRCFCFDVQKLKRGGLIIFVLVIFVSFAISAVASSAYGYAVYRNGAFGGISWHAGLLFDDSFSEGNTEHVYHIDNLIQGVTLCSGDDFLNNNVFMGYYRPNTVLTQAQKINVLTTAYILEENYDIGYNAFYQVNYPSSLTGTVMPLDITSIRCDGVVEYCYEYNNIRIYGSDANWNVSIASADIKSAHSGFAITPKDQALYYMVNLLGDIDGDGTVSSEDSRLASRAAVGLENFNEYQFFVADVTGDGEIESDDARLILRFATGQETSFPATPTDE